MNTNSTVRLIAPDTTARYRRQPGKSTEVTTGGVTVVDGLDAGDWMTTLYTELRQLAHARMRRLSPGHTLQPTALVHEVYIRLQKRNIVWANRAHFYFVAARAMRDILAEYARKKIRKKHGGHLQRVEFTISIPDHGGTMSAHEILHLHHALEHMQTEHPEQAELVQLYYFGGLTYQEIAHHTQRSQRSVERHMRFARAWLKRHLSSIEDAAP